jgi:transposase
MPRGPGGRGSFPPSQRLDVISLASSATAEHDRPATGWTLDELATTLINQAHHAAAMSRSTIWRALDDVDLKPHRSVYWLNSHDPDFDAKAREICRLYVQAPAMYQRGHLLICCDEKTGMQVLERKEPTRPGRPGYPARRERDYIRHGTRALIGSFVVATGEVVWDVGPTRTGSDFAAHVRHVARHFPEVQRFDWVVDQLNTHWTLELCRAVAESSGVAPDESSLRRGPQRRAFLSDPSHKHVFHYLPVHGSWLNQIELWFSVLARRWLKRGDFASVEAFETGLRAFLDDYHAHHAHPYRWTYTGEPLVHGIPFGRTRKHQQQGRAWFSPRPQRFERLLYPPRPYMRRAEPTG